MNRPHIIKNDILATLDTYERAVNEIGLYELDRRMAVGSRGRLSTVCGAVKP